MRHTPHDITACEREDEGASPDSAYMLAENARLEEEPDDSGENAVRLRLALRGKQPCCSTCKDNYDEADDDAPATLRTRVSISISA